MCDNVLLFWTYIIEYGKHILSPEWQASPYYPEEVRKAIAVTHLAWARTQNARYGISGQNLTPSHPGWGGFLFKQLRSWRRSFNVFKLETVYSEKKIKRSLSTDHGFYQEVQRGSHHCLRSHVCFLYPAVFHSFYDFFPDAGKVSALQQKWHTGHPYTAYCFRKKFCDRQYLKWNISQDRVFGVHLIHRIGALVFLQGYLFHRKRPELCIWYRGWPQFLCPEIL